MKTICIDCRYIGPRPSGIAEMVRGLVDHVPALAPDLRFLLLRHPAHEGQLSNMPNVREQVVRHAANGPTTMWWLSKVIDLSQVDLFHATFNIMPAGLVVPCLVTIHDIMRLTNPVWCRPGLRGQLERHFYGIGIRRSLRSADAIAAISTATAREIAAYCPAAAGRTIVTPSGVSRHFHPCEPDASALAALGIAPDRRFVLTVGQDAPYKNHEGAVRAFAAAFAADPSIDFVIVQRRGAGRWRLENLARSLGVFERIHFLPAVDTQTLLMLYGAATVLLHPSFVEGFGNPIVEAMACGCPVVTSAVSSMPEVAGGAALLADPHDFASIASRLLEVVRSPARAESMRRAGLARVRTMQWRDFAAKHVAIYRQLLLGAERKGSRFSESGTSNGLLRPMGTD